VIKATDIAEYVNPSSFLKTALLATSSKAIKNLLTQLPIVGENEYLFDASDPERGWVPGYLHWFPVGRDRGNAGRIKHAGSPENPIAERTINAMEALIELERQLELRKNASVPEPNNPRDAVKRYFDLPPLDVLPAWKQLIRGLRARAYAREIARRIRVRLVRETRPVEYTILVEDEGIGQTAERMHLTLLSLGTSDKPEKPYLIGVFGQGGSSAYAASDFSWIVSRREATLLENAKDTIGWTVIKHIYPKGRRDDYWAYLVAHPNGQVPGLPASALHETDFKHGTRVAHINYNFGKTEPSRTLYPSLNHLLFNPVLPYELYTGPDRPPDPMYGNGYRLSLLRENKKALDKRIQPQEVEKKRGDSNE
jgi:hypothetical protein